ncbi:MAG: primosomal protein N' [Candidatus Aminicenantes bacterium]|nr:primosomal protein N' [Candidatus Aminicenantes bacterium]
MTLLADVVFPLPLDQSFSYIVPAGSADTAKPGVRVLAPLGRKTQPGFIVAVHDLGSEPGRPLKEIAMVIDAEPVFSASTLAFTGRLSGYFFSSWGELLQAALPPSLEIKTKAKVRLTEAGARALQEKSLSRDEKKAADVLGPDAFTILHLRRTTGLKTMAALIARMAKKGLVQVVEEKSRPRKSRTIPADRTGPKQLELDFAVEPAVRKAMEAMRGPLEGKRFAPFYLYGGRQARRAAYGVLIQKVIAQGRQALVLMPEVAASEPFKESLGKRLGETAAFLHGQMPEGAREREWQRIKAGRTRVVVGPRSALFAPLESAGLVIVDDEHDDAYLQTERPVYDARVGARFMAAEQGALLVYGSDVPTVEAFHEARSGGYLLALPGDPERRKVVIVDDASERGLFAPRFRDGLRAAIQAGRPGIVFLNRRGYASFLFCPRCGYIPKCDRCDISLAYYKKEERLVCRYCAASRPHAAACPKCGSRVMEPRGAGVEAAEEELRRLFPGARVSGFDSDRVRTKAAREKVLRNFEDGKIDVLVGTQMLARQAGLPSAAWVGILNPEALLAFADFRASQKTFQAVHRMMRCASLADEAGSEVVIQTAFPEHHSIREAGRQDYEAFFEQEIRFRRLMDYPPFAAMAEIVLLGRDRRPLAQKAREFVRRARACGPDIEILGPALAPPSLLKGERGVQVILKSRAKETLDACLAKSLGTTGVKRSVARYG